MFQIDDATAVGVEPTPGPAGTPGFFTDGDLLAGIRATVLTADWANSVQDELLAILTAAGITPVKATRNQVLTAIETLVEARVGGYLVDTGTVNHYVVTFAPPVSVYPDGLQVRFKVGNTNTLASDLNAGGGVRAILREDAAPLQAGDLIAGWIATVNFSTAANAFQMAGLVPSQFGTAAKKNTGRTVIDPGDGTLETAEPYTSVAGAVTVHLAQSGSSYVCSAAATLTIDRSTTLFNGWFVDLDAQGGPITFVPDSHDSVAGQTAGASYLLSQGQTARVFTNAAGNFGVKFLTIQAGSSPAPQYINSSQTIGSGQYDVDASAGTPIILALATGLNAGVAIRLIDSDASWRANPVTLTAPSGETIMGFSSFALNTHGEDVLFKKNASKDWRLQ